MKLLSILYSIHCIHQLLLWSLCQWSSAPLTVLLLYCHGNCVIFCAPYWRLTVKKQNDYLLTYFYQIIAQPDNTWLSYLSFNKFVRLVVRVQWTKLYQMLGGHRPINHLRFKVCFSRLYCSVSKAGRL